MANYFRPRILASFAVVALISAMALTAPAQAQGQGDAAQHPLPLSLIHI